MSEFVRRQLEAGRFHSESELVHTALNLLEDRLHAQDDRTWLKNEIDRGLCSRPADPVTPAFWAALRRRVDAAAPGHVG